VTDCNDTLTGTTSIYSDQTGASDLMLSGKLLSSGVGVILLCCLLPAVATAATDGDPTARELLGGLVAIPTTEETGRAREAAEYLAEHLLAAGFPQKDVQLLGPSETVGGLVARLPGRGTERPVLLLAHLDVVPAATESWSVAPYELIDLDGYLYGRGTLDNKTGAATLIANLIRLRTEGIVPERDIIVVLTLDEESNMLSIRWLLEHQESLRDAEFALNTDSGSVQLIDGKPTVFGIQAAEKVYMTLELRADNPGGHSSVPQHDNAIYTLAKALNRIAEYQFPVNLNDTTRAFFANPAKSVSEPLASAMRALGNEEANAQQLALLTGVPSYNALMRTTCVATQISGGHAENALPTYAIAVINCRILPQEKAEDTEVTLLQIIADDSIKMRITYEAETSPPSPLVPEILDRVTQIASEMYPGAKVMPVMATSATDGLYSRSAGVPTYGISAIARTPEDNREHGVDERIKRSAFDDSVEFWYRIMQTL